MKAISILVGILVLAACNIVPNQIAVEENTNLVNYKSIDKTQVSPSQVGELARWGGKIVSVENKKDVSEIEVVFFPESRSGKPRVGDESLGRFKAVVKGFVDPLVFEEGRLVTVVGSVGELTEGVIGEQTYKYPTLDAKGYYMWRKTTDLEVESVGFSPFLYSQHYRRGFFSPWYDPWWGKRQRVRVIHDNGHSQGSRVRPTPKSQPRVVPRNISEPAPTSRDDNGNVVIDQNTR